jgi:mannose-6-phosphate isomerase-like protein (cupin superfamily)
MNPPSKTPQVARFSELKPFGRAFLDSYIPSYQKENYRVIGSGVFEDPVARPVINGPHGFSVGYIRCAPGKGAALHSHRTIEVFIPMNGKMVVAWGDNGEHEMVLEPWDTVSVPVGQMRAFRNPNDFPLVLMAIIQDGPSGPERVAWHEEVIREAGKAGVTLDDDGNLLVASS